MSAPDPDAAVGEVQLMRLRDLIGLLEGEILWGEDLAAEIEVAACFAADLMSDVLAFSLPGALLVTGLTSPQSAHTADVADMIAVLYVSGKKPAHPVLELAREKQLPLLCTRLSMFDACGVLHKAGLKSAIRT